MTGQQQLNQLLRRLFNRMAPAVLSQVQHGSAPSLSSWLPVLQEAVKPILFPLWQAGARRGVWRLRDDFRPKRKALPRIDFDFSLFNQRILQAVDETVFDFCRSTLATIESDIATSMRDFREKLSEGLKEGETAKQLGAEVLSIFRDPMRAHRIAQAETSRAVHGGQMLADKESGIVGKKEWLASSDACPVCKSIMRRGPIPLDEPFHVWPKAGPYAVIMYPPAHPFCFCTYKSIVDYAAVTADVGPSYNRPGLAIRERLSDMMEEMA